jgi:hypothetical protein
MSRRATSLIIRLVRQTGAICFLFTAVFAAEKNGPTLAFPGAEGFGRYTSGGRGGRVIEVTNLNDSGPGSLRAAVEASGRRTIVFRVSGNIDLASKLVIRNDNITIAGQTAPGDGICVRYYSFGIDADNVIIRYVRFRLGDEKKVESDAFTGEEHDRLIIDHCSASWSVDECMSFYKNRNFTMQWCLDSESLYHSVHSKGNHGYGGIWGGMGASFHHNLLAHHSSRNPRFSGGRDLADPTQELVDHRNNVIYNWGFNSAYGGEVGKQNMIANYYKYGPATKSDVRYRIVEPYDNVGRWYIADNFFWGTSGNIIRVNANNWSGGVQGDYAQTAKADTPFPAAPVVTHTAENAFELVLADAGANVPKRDSLDLRIIREVRNGTATYGGTFAGPTAGIIDSQGAVGGWPVLNSLPAPADTDHDGMPDEYEMGHGLNFNDPDDGALDADADGYTHLEEYLNGLCVRKDFLAGPAELKAMPLSASEIQLTWKEMALNESGFKIMRYSGDSLRQTMTTAANDTLFIDRELQPNTSYAYRVSAFNEFTQSIASNRVQCTTLNSSTRINQSDTAPDQLGLAVSNYPNPFNANTRLQIRVPACGKVRLTVYNVLGIAVAHLLDSELTQGFYTVTWDAGALQSGVYWALAQTAWGQAKTKLLLVR